MLKSLFQNATDFMGVLDTSGRLLLCNKASRLLIGKESDEIQGVLFWETPWWDHDPTEQARLRQAIATAAAGEFVRLDVTHLGVDGVLRIVDFSITPGRDERGVVRWIFPEGRDITAQRQAEVAQRESEEKFRQIFQRSHDGLLLLDGDRFIECNAAAQVMMRCTQPELLRMHPWELSPPTQPDGRPSGDKALEMIAQAHAKGGHRFEWMHRRVDGTDFPVEVTLTPFPLMGHDVLYTSWRDISDRKQEERERIELERRALHAQKLESLGILAGGIAHDFNNLMTAMMGRLEEAKHALAPGHGALEHLRILDDILHRATDLTGQMLAYSGKGRFVVGPADLSQVVRGMADLFSSSVPKKVELELALASGLPSVEADVAQLQQVLLNLVTNASDAIGDVPGRVRIETGVETLDAATMANLRTEVQLSPGPHVFLEVSDTGTGIPAEVAQRIFEPFFSTKDTGRGLGLSAMLGILRAHRGAFGLHSTPGVGTTFRLFFPVTATPAAVTTEVPAVRAELPPGLRVLLVEDEESIRQITARLLKRLDCEVATAVDGVDALDALATKGPFAVVLLDLTMPRMDGRQALAEISKLYPGLPVVICSGYSEHEIKGGWRGVFLPKPYSLGELRGALRSALAGVAASSAPRT